MPCILSTTYKREYQNKKGGRQVFVFHQMEIDDGEQFVPVTLFI
jgi:hypothetical protein